MPRIPIPLSEPVDDCSECQAACCRANEIFDLTFQEVAFMTRVGNKLLKVVLPSPKPRRDAPYPRGLEWDTETGMRTYYVDPERPTEPLSANFGRYVLLNDCKYLETDQDGWEHCGVYEERPGACQQFEEGGDKCHLMQQIQQARAIDEA